MPRLQTTFFRSVGTALLAASSLLLVPAMGSAQAGSQPVTEGEEAQVFVGALEAISQMHQKAVSDSALWNAALDGMIESLQDPYATVFTPVEAEAWEEETTGNYSGVGLQITELNDVVTVTAVFRSTPAEDVGIQVGDVIVGVNEHDATEWTTGTAADSIRGPVGTRVTVRMQRPGYDDPISFDIRRDNVHVPAVVYGVMEGDIGYTIMDRVARDAAKEMDAALQELQDTRGLIIDLRRNPGGFLDESLMLADLFLEPGSTLASTSQRAPGAASSESETESYQDRWPTRVEDLPVVILVDRFTASGAEILAGALQDYDRALVVGERSFGKGVVQTVMRLPHGRRLRFTTGEWQTPLGRSLHRPRDMQMQPLGEDLDTFPRVTTPEGRTLVDGGGIFPDLEIEGDTLTTVEQNLIRTANEAELPLGLRLAEYSFETARTLGEAGEAPHLADAALERFLTDLVEEGLPEEAIASQQARDYLAWRLRVGIAQRMNDVGAEANARMERDPVLTEAVRLLGGSTTQAQLFEAAEAREMATHSEDEGQAGSGGGA